MGRTLSPHPKRPGDTEAVAAPRDSSYPWEQWKQQVPRGVLSRQHPALVSTPRTRRAAATPGRSIAHRMAAAAHSSKSPAGGPCDHHPASNAHLPSEVSGRGQDNPLGEQAALHRREPAPVSPFPLRFFGYIVQDTWVRAEGPGQTHNKGGPLLALAAIRSNTGYRRGAWTLLGERWGCPGRLGMALQLAPEGCLGFPHWSRGRQRASGKWGSPRLEAGMAGYVQTRNATCGQAVGPLRGR